MCEPNEHKFRTNLDTLTIAGGASAGIHSKAPLTPHVTIIFCEKCGFVVHDANYPAHKRLLNPK